MITVYIWHGTYGHAALEITGNSSTGYQYVSFHPKQKTKRSGGLSSMPSIPELLGGGVEAELPIDYEQDTFFMGQIQNGELKAKPYAEKVVLENLDEIAIAHYWQDMKDNQAKYQLMFRNCSTVVVQCLIVGWISILSPDKRELTQATLKEKMAYLRQQIVAFEYQGDGYLETEFAVKKYKYTGGVIGKPQLLEKTFTVAVLSSFASIGLAFVAPWLAAGTLAMGAISALLGRYYDLGAWDPNLVHNIALFLKEEIG